MANRNVLAQGITYINVLGYLCHTFEHGPKVCKTENFRPKDMGVYFLFIFIFCEKSHPKCPLFNNLSR